GEDPERGFFTLDAADARGDPAPIRLVFLNTGEGSQVSEGILTDAQFRWLACELDRAEADDRLVVLLSHHQEANVSRITDPLLRAGEGAPYCESLAACEARIEALLHAHPNVVLHLVGHGHANRIVAHPFVPGEGEAASPERGYWEIETSSIIDWPQQSRVVELVAYPDGVGEIWSTVVDHAPLASDPDLNALTELGRVLSANDPQRRLKEPVAGAVVDGEGTPEDRNRVLRFAIPPGPLARIYPDGAARPEDGVITSRDRFGAR
ncbi:MAG: hypothetical protein K8I02_00820, partial [Candidatus Methylomirabilis sp.]|nr:hypothetical protein [Deltaproteobacteria bacterium]